MSVTAPVAVREERMQLCSQWRTVAATRGPCGAVPMPSQDGLPVGGGSTLEPVGQALGAPWAVACPGALAG